MDWPADKIERKKVSELIPYARNARTHSDEQVAQIAASINEWGWTTPVLIDEGGEIIAGHGRVLAARKLGIEEVPAMTATGWSDAQKHAYVLADNQLPMNAEWDMDMLKLEMKDLDSDGFDLSLIGFDDDILSGLMVDETEGLTDEDAVPDVPENPVTVLGDVWLLGKHRLMCGDSTSIDAVDKLMDGQKADMGFCDPPYNLGFEYNLYDDNKTAKEYEDFSHTWFSNLKTKTQRQIITLGTKNLSLMARMGDVAGVACWVKKNWITSCHIAKLQQWEPIFFFGDFTKFKRSSDLFEINRVVQKDVGDNHTCPKQIILIEDLFEHYSTTSVLDLFGGSGTTMIAAEKLGRASYLMELDPKYCDVIVKRWEDFTGKTATLQNGISSSISLLPDGNTDLTLAPGKTALV
tara:strand:- start:760 stop:1980 length:1221 start_codon:yes stop_codon:yes gene_type:complete